MRILPVLFLLAAGCLPEQESAPPLFDISCTGTVEGVVRWPGPVPRVEPFRSLEFVHEWLPGPKNRMRDFPNPAAPHISTDGGLAGAVVYLRGIDPARSKPWDHPPISVRLNKLRLLVCQGGQEGAIGVALAGSDLRIVSQDEHLHTIRGRGASFFGLTLPEKGCERTWKLDNPGLVELRSGAGFFWMRGHVMVSRHPYVAVTDHRGRFRMEGVPEGKTELVAVLPDWRVTEAERNVDNMRVMAVSFGPPLEKEVTLHVKRGETARAEMTLDGERR